MANYEQEIIEQLKRMNARLDIIASSQVMLLQAFSLMHVANTNGDVQAAWKEVKSVAVEMLKKNHEIG